MRIIDYKDYELKVSPEAYTIKAFKELIDRDKSKDKLVAIKELALLYWVYDPRSDLQYITNENDRMTRAKELIGIKLSYKLDAKFDEAKRVYLQLVETSSSMLLSDIKIAVEKLRAYIRNSSVDDETFEKYTKTINSLIPINEKLSALEGKVIKEVEEVSKMRGDKAMTILDSGMDRFF